MMTKFEGVNGKRFHDFKEKLEIVCTWGELAHHKAALSSAGNTNKCLCSFKGERGESHNKQGERAACARVHMCVCMCVFVCAREKERDRRGVSERESRERSKQGVCF